MWGLSVNPAVDIEKPSLGNSGDIEVFSPEEVWALVRAAAGEQDAAIFLTATFTGLRRGELLALRRRDVDFAGSAIRVRAATTRASSPRPSPARSARCRWRPTSRPRWPSSGTGRTPPAPTISCSPARDGYLDGSTLRRRYEAAIRRGGLRRLRFHDLRHTFGTRMISEADIRRVQEWMGHADVQTTMKYLHYAPRAEDAALVARAFQVDSAAAGSPERR